MFYCHSRRVMCIRHSFKINILGSLVAALWFFGWVQVRPFCRKKLIQRTRLWFLVDSAASVSLRHFVGYFPEKNIREYIVPSCSRIMFFFLEILLAIFIFHAACHGLWASQTANIQLSRVHDDFTRMTCQKTKRQKWSKFRSTNLTRRTRDKQEKQIKKMVHLFSRFGSSCDANRWENCSFGASRRSCSLSPDVGTPAYMLITIHNRERTCSRSSWWKSNLAKIGAASNGWL